MSKFKLKLPGTFKFITDFFDAMNNKKSGHSLRKWLAVGFYWIMLTLSLRYTDQANLVPVLGIHGGLITALVITYTAGNIQEKKIDSSSEPAADEQA
jgi:hypothetical protein